MRGRLKREKRRVGKRQRRDSIADSAFAWLRRDKCGMQIAEWNANNWRSSEPRIGACERRSVAGVKSVLSVGAY